MKVLVVEDDEGTAGFIAAGLATRGHEPTVARDGREGYERAGADRFDVIVLDRMLPKLDGLGVVALMRKDGVSTPVLFLTNASPALTTGSTDSRPAGTTISSSPSLSRS
jgi:two-component system OmpR family response regulator